MDGVSQAFDTPGSRDTGTDSLNTATAAHASGIPASASNAAGMPGTPGGLTAPDPDSRITRYPPGPSLKPAMWVLGLAASILVIGAIASGVFGGSGYVAAPARVSRSGISGISAVPAVSFLKAIESNGQPPLNVIYAITVPGGTVAQGIVTTPGHPTSYDKAMAFVSRAGQQQIIDFYSTQLPLHRWSLVSKGTSSGSRAYYLIARANGSDGEFWELGITIYPTSFSPDRLLPRAATRNGDTHFVMRLFPVSSEAAS
ncbi:MAG: hypothetical protein M1399_04475 [Actinobacteria bacterium]|nr:hypothetical protein [Actinomycetota bacterium]MCL5447467.1 hypothetical protein [Actinomycetota bacterium]